MKIAINRCFGGFSLSDKAIEMIMNRKGFDCYRYKWQYERDKERYTRVDNLSNDRLGLSINYSTADLGKVIEDIPKENRWYYGNLKRTDEDMIAVIEELGDEASGMCGEVVIVEIPDDVDWEIDEYDGLESIHEVHRVWC
jgi:hypothetical protein